MCQTTQIFLKIKHILIFEKMLGRDKDRFKIH